MFFFQDLKKFTHGCPIRGLRPGKKINKSNYLLRSGFFDKEKFKMLESFFLFLFFFFSKIDITSSHSRITKT